MPRLELPDKFCLGVDAPDGRTYRADRPGSAVVTDALADHFESHGFFVSRGSTAFNTAKAQTIECPNCGHERWGWVDRCRCGGAA